LKGESISKGQTLYENTSTSFADAILLHYVLEFATSMAEVQLSCAIEDIIYIHWFMIL